MSNPTIIGIIAGAITIIGWFVTSYLKARSDERTNIVTSYLKSVGEEKEKRRKHCERQIEELYGPLFNLTHRLITLNHVLYSLVKEGNPERGQFMPNLELEGIVEIEAWGVSSQDLQKIKDFFHELYFEPLHKEIYEILKTKVHLINQGKIPSSWYQYLRHSTQEEAQYHLARKQGIDTISVRGFPFPDDFHDDIKNSLLAAIQMHEQYLRAELVQPNTELEKMIRLNLKP